MAKVLLISPPFTQLNTPYPATAYLKGFLNTQEISSFQLDLGLEVILEIFSKKGLDDIFLKVLSRKSSFSKNAQRIFSLRKNYLESIDPVIQFLQGTNSTLAVLISERNFLPEASRFQDLDDLEWAFGSMGTYDKARYLATLFLEDLSDFIKETLDPDFGFSRYAEQLGRSARSFDELNNALNQKKSWLDEILFQQLETCIKKENPDLVALTVPFPGNLYGAFKSAQFIKENHPKIKLVLGGGFVNTELRSLKEIKVFNYFDFITLDDGERPLLNIIKFLKDEIQVGELKRTFLLENGEVVYKNNIMEADFPQRLCGTPDYTDLPLRKYLSVIEIANPMHRLWSDGRWNKLTLAHGCYWGKCTFCDISLDYIGRYEPLTAQLICDRIEEIIEKTGENGFHFVDEAAPPALMKELALEILKRGLTVVWWTNIRFEKSFSLDLCKLLAASGCVAVSGGLEVASNRLLELIDKGVSVEQVAKVTANFTDAGIMVHSYLMYGFPSQSAQETIDSLEVVRQLFENGIVHSGFWHRFALTAHSPAGMHPDKFKIKILDDSLGSFANNDLEYIDETGCDHGLFSEGLRKSLFNFMHGIGFEFNLSEWFDHKVPKTKISSDFIAQIISEKDFSSPKESSKCIWLGNLPEIEKSKGKKTELLFVSKNGEFTITVGEKEHQWLKLILPKLQLNSKDSFSYGKLAETYQEHTGEPLAMFLHSMAGETLRENGFLIL